jgi:hypothetical protein
MPAVVHRISTHDPGADQRAIEPLRVLTAVAILIVIATAVLVSVEAMSAPLAGWASVQTFASLAPV